MVALMTKAEAQALAAWDRDYVAKPIRNSRAHRLWADGRFWGVWCVTSDHWVEFDQADIDRAVQK
jgi:hypothetical protein